MTQPVTIDKAAPRERPILFSAPMIRAIVEGKKTQTRRIARFEKCPQPIETTRYDTCAGVWWVGSDEHQSGVLCPYGKPGERLWVRETWQYGSGLAQRAAGDGLTATGPAAPRVLYRADGAELPDGCVWRPSIFMRRTESRLILEVTEVRVERLNDIDEADARAEGVVSVFPELGTGDVEPGDSCRYAFETLWDRINKDRASWASNPWVWVVSFRRLK